ncbi:MAG: response regulator, partial [Nanoarchaeota archaeon]|nr:response regulator [Nanoarchaeota archaeon]MBU1704804.1 response regulator [Nanoarchaeota archaeon]
MIDLTELLKQPEVKAFAEKGLNGRVELVDNSIVAYAEEAAAEPGSNLYQYIAHKGLSGFRHEVNNRLNFTAYFDLLGNRGFDVSAMIEECSKMKQLVNDQLQGLVDGQRYDATSILESIDVLGQGVAGYITDDEKCIRFIANIKKRLSNLQDAVTHPDRYVGFSAQEVTEADTAKPQAGNSAVGQGQYRVLVVEDDPSQRELLQIYLSQEPRISVATASNGVEALGTAKDYRPQCVLTDYNMQGMNG